MEKSLKIVLSLVVLVLLVIIIAFSLNKKGPEQLTIQFGFIGPLTGDGASYGQSEKNAVELAVKEINEKGGVNSKLLEIVYEDGKCEGIGSVTAANKLINLDKVKVILGGICSGETLAVSPITEENKVILFSAFSTNADITKAGDFVFRNAPSDLEGGKQAAEMVFNDGHRKAAVLSENTDYAQGVRNVFKEHFKALGGEITADEVYEPEDKDYRTQITKIKQSLPGAVFFSPQTGVSAGLSVKQTKEQKVNVPYYGTVLFSGGDALTNGGDALNGLKFVDAPGLSEDNPKAVSFLGKYLQNYPEPSSDYMVGARYDSVYLIAEAIESCEEVDTTCIRNYLYNLVEYDGVIGKYRFDQNGDLVGIKYIIKQIVGGEIVELK